MAFSIAVVQKTQFMHHSHDSGHKEHALSNVCYLKPPHLVTHRIRNEIQKKKRHVRCWHGTWLWICSRNSPCHLCETLQMQRPALTVLHCTRWQAILPTVTLAPGMAQHRNSHTSTHTHTHTCIREHFHPIGTALANQYARKPQGLVSHCFQTRPNSSYRKIYCTTRG